MGINMETTKYVGKVLNDGHLFIPSKALLDLGLTVGDEIEIVLKKLSKDKVRRRKQTAEEAMGTFSESRQKRLSELLCRNREGELTRSELLELERLVFEAQLKTLEKAKQLYLQKKEKAEVAAF